MKIAISSGKGGTGKTTVATNLAVTAAGAGFSVAYLDCDVEEPNGALFLRPEVEETRPVRVSVPAVDHDHCIGCGRCGQICQYSAIVFVGGEVLTFPELCHACAGCWLACPVGAVTESTRSTGELTLGRAGDVAFVQGLLDIGEAMSPPVITAVHAAGPAAEVVFVDSPPGTSCSAIESVRGVDLVVLVTEPTPFGLNDLRLAVEMVRALGLPLVVIVNRAGVGDDRTRTFCRDEGIEILAEIPDDRAVAEAYSRGELACETLPVYGKLFAEILNGLVPRCRARPSCKQ